VVDVAFHEVWWADVNERLTLGKQVRFWLWGLSIAGVASYTETTLPGAQNLRHPANLGKLTLLQRVRLFFVAISFGLSAFSIAIVNAILKRLNFDPLLSTGTIVNYLSGVKLYSQQTRAGGGPMDGPDEPPRAAMRRRMVCAMVDAATTGYDRWYILAHSLGSIVAWNGIMEPEEGLPNYLDEVRWKRVHATPGMAGRSQRLIQINCMMPNRPVWLGAREIIVRRVLFEKFCGILTYGCPLERFGALWPKMVPINPDHAFPPQAEWVNVYDPTDPVGTWISNFGPIATGSAVFAVNKLSLPRFSYPTAEPYILFKRVATVVVATDPQHAGPAGQPGGRMARPGRKPCDAAPQRETTRGGLLDTVARERYAARMAGQGTRRVALRAVGDRRHLAHDLRAAVVALDCLPHVRESRARRPRAG
jgi:hypothetical protein